MKLSHYFTILVHVSPRASHSSDISPSKPKTESTEMSEVSETLPTASDTLIGDILEAEEPGDDSFADLGMFHDLFDDVSPGAEVSEPKLSDNIEDQVSEIIIAKAKSKSKDTKDSPASYPTVIVPTLTSSEISTAEDCRLEVSLEMKAERELRRLAFTSRQRFLTGMDLKSGLENPGITVAVLESSSVESSGGQSSGFQSSGIKNSGLKNSEVCCSEGESSGSQSSRGESSRVQNFGEFSEVRDSEANEQDNMKAYHFVSECMENLIVDSCKGCYEIESVMELCLFLNNASNHSFFITQRGVEVALAGLSTVEGESARYWNLTISWLIMVLRQTEYVAPSGCSQKDYITAKALVENTHFPRVIGKMLTTCDLGDSGQKILGPSLVKNFKTLLKNLVAITSDDRHGLHKSKFQDVLLDTLLYMTAHR